MTTIAIVEETCEARARYLESRPLPSFYMEDFSVLGIIVANFPPAHAVLQRNGYRVIARSGGGDITLDDISQLPTILTTLLEHGIQAQVGDVADTMYQA